MMYTKKKTQKKDIKTKESIISHSGSNQKNRNTALVLEELYIITEYIKKATKEKNWSESESSESRYLKSTYL